MNSSINAELLYNIDAHAKRLRFLYRIKGFGYERAIELPLLAEKLQPLFDKPLRYLDIGTGPSIFPSWVASKTNWDVTCLDKFEWVNKQREYAKKLGLDPKRFHVVVRDFLEAELEPESFDVITNISVIEHFEGALDSVAMEKSARLLKPGGMYLLTTPLNEGHARDWYLQQDVYGEKFTSKPVFFQRHYDVESFNKRIVQASGLTERERVYFGDYEEPFFNDRIVDKSGFDKIKRTLLQMNTVKHALLHGSYRDVPVSMPDMKIYTSAGVCVVLTKPERS
ncbi:MAG: class I SAM-dependent methyltransferase [Candidatus Kapabacteria bacterium]|nr:class I SAM-dependent methyltransferase [Candidatus Kapabacteria bacterium]